MTRPNIDKAIPIYVTNDKINSSTVDKDSIIRSDSGS